MNDKNKESERNEVDLNKFRQAAEKAAQIVESWPDWKKTGFQIIEWQKPHSQTYLTEKK